VAGRRRADGRRDEQREDADDEPGGKARGAVERCCEMAADS